MGGHALSINLRRIPTSKPLNVGRQVVEGLRWFVVATGIISIVAVTVFVLLGPYKQDGQGDGNKQPPGQESSNAPITPVEGNSPAENPEANSEPPNWMAWLWRSGPADWAMFIITGFAVGVAFWSLQYISDQARQTRKTAIETRKAANAARDNASAAKDTAQAMVLAERAWIDISHQQPGLQITPQFMRFSVVVKNHGRTPAQASNPKMFFQLAEVGAPLPTVPIYGRPPREVPITVVMPAESFFLWQNWNPFPEDVMGMIQSGQRILWLLGFVDYFDIFGRSYRSGYCRRYIPTPLPGSTNNLVYELVTNYNYDVEIDENGNPKN